MINVARSNTYVQTSQIKLRQFEFVEKERSPYVSRGYSYPDGDDSWAFLSLSRLKPAPAIIAFFIEILIAPTTRGKLSLSALALPCKGIYAKEKWIRPFERLRRAFRALNSFKYGI